jgi:hypothetical protein
MCVACEIEAPPTALPSLEELLEIERVVYAGRIADGSITQCRQCGSYYDPEASEAALTRRGWCVNCESEWIEFRIIRPLIASLGLPGTRRALQWLVRMARKK